MSLPGLQASRLRAAIRDTLDHEKSATGNALRLAMNFWKPAAIVLPMLFALGIVSTSTADPKLWLIRLAAAQGSAFLLVSSVGLLAVAMVEFIKHYLSEAPLYIVRNEVRLPRLESAEKLLADEGRDYLAIGSAIEVFAYPFRGGRLNRLGWPPEKVTITFRGDRIALDPRLEGDFRLTGSNNPKYSLTDYEHTFSDSSDSFRLTVGETSWLDTQRARAAVSGDAVLRHALTSFEPKRHRIPGSLCLHFVCLTSEEEFICLRRKSDVAYYPSSLSISFEEQFSIVDMQAGELHRATAWFQRAICEEVLPLTGPYHDDPAKTWHVASNYVEFMRICSCFLEEDTGNYSLLGFVKLTVSSKELTIVSHALSQRYNSLRDDEGRLFCLARGEVEKLLRGERANAAVLFKPEANKLEISDVVRDLHPTSLYRALRIARALPVSRR